MNQNTVKSELRERLRRERRERFTPSSCSIILNSPEILAAKTVTSYYSYGDEPSTREINQALLKAGKRLLLPRVNGEHLDWIEWNGDENSLIIARKLSEPVGEPIKDLSDVDVMIVPALHIDQEGYRLGQGGGFYDRALSYIPGWKVGLVHAGELTSEILPREVHDIPLNAAATPSILVRFKG